MMTVPMTQSCDKVGAVRTIAQELAGEIDSCMELATTYVNNLEFCEGQISDQQQTVTTRTRYCREAINAVRSLPDALREVARTVQEQLLIVTSNPMSVTFDALSSAGELVAIARRISEFSVRFEHLNKRAIDAVDSLNADEIRTTRERSQLTLLELAALLTLLRRRY